MAGSATVPMVAAVATEDPEIAAKIEHAPMLECSRPPGKGASQSDKVRYIRSVTPARTRISPSRMNKGMQVRMKSLSTPHIVLPKDMSVGRPR